MEKYDIDAVSYTHLIAMGAGAGAQKITTDVTGNDTAGMVAGMVASGVTAKGRCV